MSGRKAVFFGPLTKDQAKVAPILVAPTSIPLDEARSKARYGTEEYDESGIESLVYYPEDFGWSSVTFRPYSKLPVHKSWREYGNRRQQEAWIHDWLR